MSNAAHSRNTGLPDPYANGLRLAAAGRHGEAIVQFETALGRDPNDGRVLFALGNTARALGMADAAEQLYRQVLTVEPGRIEAEINLANLLRGRGQIEAALFIVTASLARSPESSELWLTLGSCQRELGDFEEARHSYEQSLKFKTDYVPALVNLADMLADEPSRREEALSLYTQAIKREPDNAQAKMNRAILHFLSGNLKDGWRDYGARLKLANKVPVAGHSLPRWDGVIKKSLRLFVSAEQGVGDQIMFASVLPEVNAALNAVGGKLILECDPRLATLLSRSLPGASVYPAKIQTIGGVAQADHSWLKHAGGANAFAEMGSLPRLMRKAMTDFPEDNAFLIPDAGEKAFWRANFEGLGDGPVIGICWRSGNLAGHRQLQYAPLEAWAGFLEDAPGQIVCAQYDATPEEVAKLSLLSGRKIHVPDGLDQKNELDRTAAMLSALDHLVTAPTAVAWLGSGTGVSTYKMLYDTSWTSFGEAHEPFAPSCYCVMPERRGDWRDGFGQVLSALNG